MTNKEAIEVLQRVCAYGVAEDVRQKAIQALMIVDCIKSFCSAKMATDTQYEAGRAKACEDVLNMIQDGEKGSATVNYVKHDEIQFCSKCKKNKKCTKQMEMLNKFTCEGYEECEQ